MAGCSGDTGMRSPGCSTTRRAGSWNDRWRIGFGRVPIVRLFDRRRPRSRNIGLPRYESIAELQREYYNRDSELILSDTTQAHPLLQGPEDYVQADGTVPVGPNWLLPKKKNQSGAAATYEGFDVIQFPKEGAESIRLNKADLRDAADRAALLLKPAGAAGTAGSTVAQSGLAKRLDQAAGNDLLSKIAATLGRAEEQIAELALMVLDDGIRRPDQQAVLIHYPTEFDSTCLHNRCMRLPSLRSTPSPLVGEGWGGLGRVGEGRGKRGVVVGLRGISTTTTPTPGPSPRGGGEHVEQATSARLITNGGRAG